uniref:7TM_GPCR_Srx domain-containing protein n=1 Tax=Caenorhabditis tropicalis TaxID=1561998 RepID=A0A1I7TXZ2_9PELO
MSAPWVMILKNLHNQAAVNFGMIIISMHGVVSSLVMIVVHRPYREAVVFKLFSRERALIEVSEKSSRGPRARSRLVDVN